MLTEEIKVFRADMDAYLIFQAAEETGEGAKLCRALLREKQITEIYGFHNIPLCGDESCAEGKKQNAGENGL